MAELARAGHAKDRGLQSTWLQGVMWEWMSKLRARLEADSRQTGKDSAWGKEPDIARFLSLLTPEKMALITIVELLRLSGAGGVSDGMKSTRAIIHIGKAIETEFRTQELKDRSVERSSQADLPTAKAFEKEYERLSDGAPGGNRTLEFMWRRERAAAEEKGEKLLPPDWTQSIRAKVGSILIAALSDVATVERTVQLPSGEWQCVFLPSLKPS